MKYIFPLMAICLSTTAFAQTDTTRKVSDSVFLKQPDSLKTHVAPDAPPQTKLKSGYRKNVVKMNVAALLFQNYSFTLERSLTRKITASVGYRVMPKTQLSKLPVLKKLYKAAGATESDLHEEWDDLIAGNNSGTLDFRFYAGRKPGPRGAYIGLYGRYAKFNVDYNYVYEGDPKSYDIPIQSTTTGFAVGIYSGVQWLIGKRVALDWQLFGWQWGKLNGHGSSVVDLAELSASDKQTIKEDLESKLPSFGNKSSVNAQVNDKGVTINVREPFVGIRSAISLGIAF